MEQFDQIISLGYNCEPADMTKLWKLQTTLGPFDCVHSASFSSIVRFFSNQFDGFLARENIDIEPSDNMSQHLVYDRQSHICFIHDFTKKKTVDERFPLIFDNYKFRVRLMLEGRGKALLIRKSFGGEKEIWDCHQLEKVLLEKDTFDDFKIWLLIPSSESKIFCASSRITIYYFSDTPCIPNKNLFLYNYSFWYSLFHDICITGNDQWRNVLRLHNKLIGALASKCKDRKIILWGCGYQSIAIIAALDWHHIPCSLVYDTQILQFRSVNGKYEYISKNEFVYRKKDYFVLVTPIDNKAITTDLETHGFINGEDFFLTWDYVKEASE